MYLRLINFRKYTDQTITLSAGSNIIVGNNGHGKSTLLESIRWVLYAKPTNVKRKGSNQPTTVIMQLLYNGNVINITRVSSPKSLRLQYMGQQYSDEYAQSVIIGLFGNHDIWHTCCYLQQSKLNAMLCGTEKERINIIEQLCFGNIPFNDINKRIDSLIRQYSEQVQYLQGKYDTLLNQYTAHYGTNIPSIIEFDMDKYNAICNKYRTTTEIYNKHNMVVNKLSTLRQDLDNSNKMLDNLMSNIPQKPQFSINALNGMSRQHHLRSQLALYKDHNIDDLDEATSILNEYNYNMQLMSQCGVSSYTDAQLLISQIEKQQDGYQKYNRYMLASNKLGNKDDHIKLLEHLRSQPSNATLRCPSCNTGLNLSDDKLVVVDQSIHNRIKHLEYIIRAIDELGSPPPYYDVPDINKLNKLRNIKDIKEPSFTYDQITSTRQYRQLSAQLDNTISIPNDFDLQVEMQLHNAYSSWTNNVANVKSTISQLEANVHSLEQQLTTLQYGDYDAIVNEYNDMVSKYNQMQYYRVMQQEYDNLYNVLTSLNNAKQHLDRCFNIKRAIDVVIRRNIIKTFIVFEQHVNNIISDFFINDAVTVTVSKDDKHINKLVLEIIINGITHRNLSSLSGGERNKLSIIFTLALSHMCNFPWLIMDESLVQLDSSSRDNVVSLIGKLSHKSIVIVSHTITDGVFNNVVRV